MRGGTLGDEIQERGKSEIMEDHEVWFSWWTRWAGTGGFEMSSGIFGFLTS